MLQILRVLRVQSVVYGMYGRWNMCCMWSLWVVDAVSLVHVVVCVVCVVGVVLCSLCVRVMCWSSAPGVYTVHVWFDAAHPSKGPPRSLARRGGVVVSERRSLARNGRVARNRCNRNASANGGGNAAEFVLDRVLAGRRVDGVPDGDKLSPDEETPMTWLRATRPGELTWLIARKPVDVSDAAEPRWAVPTP